MGISFKEKVNNVPGYAWNRPIWVCSFDEDGKLWFYGAWDEEDFDTAEEAARFISGIVITK